MTLLAILLSGPLADRFFESLMAEDSALADVFLWVLLSTDPGSGIELMFNTSCLFKWKENLLAHANLCIRDLETEIPDAISVKAGGSAETAVRPVLAH
jgi:hypothetical protein